ncbi:MAG: hypothetical protein COB46_05965 [Rhodospirillaceae bacterium]|nr:MAG: hypothetical protein COB46_05965 [Rhodospirillaceae bacterium]
MARILTSLSWVFGTLALIMAVMYPYVINMVVVQPARQELQSLVNTVVKAQLIHFSENKRYVYFAPDPVQVNRAQRDLKGIQIDAPSFSVEAFGSLNTPLIVRATTRSTAMNQDGIPPLMYKYTIPKGAAVGQGEWVQLSGEEPGLLSGLF